MRAIRFNLVAIAPCRLINMVRLSRKLLIANFLNQVFMVNTCSGEIILDADCGKAYETGNNDYKNSLEHFNILSAMFEIKQNAPSLARPV